MLDGAARDLGTIVELSTVRWEAQPNLCWVILRTSSGVLGLGETYYLPGAVEEVVHDLFSHLLLGRPAGQITASWVDAFCCTNFFGSAGAEMRALSAVDIALWDALGQAAGLPVYQLLGGRVRPSVHVYNTCVNAGDFQDWDRAHEDAGALARELAGDGFLGMKVWPWDEFAPQISLNSTTGPAGWSAMGPIGSFLSRRDLAAGLAMIDAIRSAAPDFEVLVEGHGRWNLNTGIQIARALEPFDPLWMEDICQPESISDLARLVRETGVRQAVSERLISRFRFAEVLHQQAAHVLMVDVAWTGGITEGRRIAELADTHQLPFAPHDCTGPVTALANLHLAISQPNCITTEVVRGFAGGYYEEVIDYSLQPHHGVLSAPDAPGLGGRLQPDFVRRAGVVVRSSS